MGASVFDEEIAAAVLALVRGGLGLATACRKDGRVSEGTFRSWVSSDAGGLSSRYASARDERADVLAEELVDIADKAVDANIARLQIDARKWYASKVAPKKYGDKQQVELSGDMVVRQLTDEELAAKLASLTDRLGGLK